MKRIVATALCMFGLVFPVSAQRGGSHGGGRAGSGSVSRSSGFSSHSIAGGGFRGSAPQRFAAPTRYPGAAPNRFSNNVGRRYIQTPGMNRTNRYPTQDYYRDGREHRHPYRSPYRAGYGYGVAPWIGPVFDPYYGWIDPDYGYASGDNVSADSDTGYVNSAPGYGDPSQDGTQQPFPYQSEPYQYQPERAPVAPPQTSETLTLIFKDGSAPEQIHNYILTRTKLLVLDQQRRDIPIDRIDLQATAKINRDAGVEFRLPDESR